MSDEPPFADFIHRIRAGDERAADEFCRRYEPLIRREVRLRWRDPRLRRLFDSMDICQSVLLSFFARAAAGQFDDLDRPENLLRLLVSMAHKKLAFHARKQRARRRDYRRLEAVTPEEWEGAAATPDPGRKVEREELIREVRCRLSAEERELWDLRAQGLGWDEVVARRGGTPQARRKQLARAVERALQELGLDEVDDD